MIYDTYLNLLAHTAHLLDMLTANDVENFEFRAFTDSNHSINTRVSLDWLSKILDLIRFL